MRLGRYNNQYLIYTQNMSNDMTITFGKDQEKTIDMLLDELKPFSVIEYSKQDLGDVLMYRIKFKNVYSAYLFGHNQATNKFLMTRDGERIKML